MNGYMTVQETAERWGVTTRQVQLLCKDNRIEGASKLSTIWLIPKTAEKTNFTDGGGRCNAESRSVNI